mmetsp:Transcript_42437/g.106940  ORF Transcript_42437/g.106940 Transcript_42437/m.106940 type:complete len:290 (-) Transcript_42437:537-1406(-)
MSEAQNILSSPIPNVLNMQAASNTSERWRLAGTTSIELLESNNFHSSTNGYALLLGEESPWTVVAQEHFEGPILAGVKKRICLLDLGQLPMVRDQQIRPQVPRLHSAHEVGDGVPVHHPGRHLEVAVPHPLEVERDPPAMDSQDGDVAPGLDDLLRDVPAPGQADGLHDQVHAVRLVPDDLQELFPNPGRALLARVGTNGVCRAHALCHVQPPLIKVDGNDRLRLVHRASSQQGGEADRPSPNDRTSLPVRHVTINESDLVGCGENVCKHQVLVLFWTVPGARLWQLVA